MAPADGKKPRRRRTSSIRDAAQSAAGSTAGEDKDAQAGAGKAGKAGRRPAGAAKAAAQKPRRRRSRTSESTRLAAAEASRGAAETPHETTEIPIDAGPPAFPDYEVQTDSWDPWQADPVPSGRTDPDFDAQRTLGEWLEGVIPADAQVHFVNAGREFAQGVQVTVDHHTGKRRQGRDGQPQPPGPSRIEIE